ncbi:MAG: formate dehydrogenase subunit gamma [Arenicella sp.]|jgi:formate dehydrogenase subunit gamma
MIANTKQQAVLLAIDENKHLEGALLPILHRIQHDLGHIPSEHVIDIAESLNLSRAEVHGVITFYHSFKTESQGKHVIEVCRAESCQAKGGRAIEAAVKAKLGIDFDQTTEDGEITLEPVYCLGNCACSPAVKINSQLYGRVTQESVSDLIDSLKAEQH